MPQIVDADAMSAQQLPRCTWVGYSKRGESRVARGRHIVRLTLHRRQGQALGMATTDPLIRTAGSNIAATQHKEERSDAHEV